jgi:hypothetical protein
MDTCWARGERPADLERHSDCFVEAGMRATIGASQCHDGGIRGLEILGEGLAGAMPERHFQGLGNRILMLI